MDNLNTIIANRRKRERYIDTERDRDIEKERVCVRERDRERGREREWGGRIMVKMIY